jgi:hypothetical protein
MALVEIKVTEAEAESGFFWRAGTGKVTAQPLKFDGSSSWSVFRRHFETVAQHNGWTPGQKAT